MSIVAECPHCETRYTLQPDLVGRAMRCPNPDCRDVFEVRPVPAEATAARPSARGAERPTAPPAATSTVVVEATLIAPPPPRPTEVVWTPDAPQPPPAPVPKRPSVEAPPAAEPVAAPRRRRKNRRPHVLAAMCVLIGLLAAGGVVAVVRYRSLAEFRAAEDAKGEYDRGNFAAAAKAYAALAERDPDGRDAERYRFFAELSAVRLTVGSVTAREEPAPALAALRAFIASRGDSPFAKPESGYGRDILEAGKKLGEDVAADAAGRVKAFRADRTKPDALRAAEDAVTAGRTLPPLLVPFRGKDDPPADALAAALDRVQVEIDGERRRMAVVARVGGLLRDPTDRAIAEAKDDLVASGLAADPEAADLIRTAEGKLLGRVRYDRDPAAPHPIPPPAAASFAFVTPVGATKAPARGALDGPPGVFLAVAAGVLYALDEDTGNPLWAARLGPDVFDPPAVARVDLADGPTDLAVVLSNVGGKPAASGYAVRTGAVRWYQELPAAAAGAAAVAGGRAFVPVRDGVGTVVVLDLATGTRAGRITLGQPVGFAVGRAGTGELYVAAESRRVFVFHTESGDGEGTSIRCVRVVETGHPPGTLRTPPTILGPPGDDPAARWLVLNQADGPAASKLRVFPLPANAQLAATDPPRVDSVAAEVELPLPGWAWFPPAADGERVGVVSDAGQFRLFGVRQPGNSDAGVFPLPHPALPASPDGAPAPGLVVPAEEGAFSVLAGGRLQKFRLTLAADRGLAVVPAGASLPVGVPTQPAQLNPAGDTACLVVRSPHSAACRAVAVGLTDGEPRWQRQLGVTPAAAAVATAAGVLIVGAEGGAVSIPAAVPMPGGTTTAPPEWVVSTPPEGSAGATVVAASADGGTVFTVTPTRAGEAARWAVRRIVGGKVEHAGTVTAPAALAGAPAVLADALLVPAADGFVYRYNPGDGRVKADTLTPGPRWLTDRRVSDPTCHLAALSADSFVASDGRRGLTRWAWPAGGTAASAGTWELRERITAVTGVAAAAGGRGPRVLVADATGGMWVYRPDRPDQPPRRWAPGRTPSLPAGLVSACPEVATDAAGVQSACYTVDGRLVCLDLDGDDPRWVVTVGGGAVVGSPRPTPAGHWLVTDLAGHVTLHDGETGKPLASRVAAPAGTVPAAAGVPLGDRVLVALSDGTVAVVAGPRPAPAEGAKE